MRKDARIYIAGHTGLVGSAMRRRLEAQGFRNLILRTHDELDLTDAALTRKFLEKERPDYVVLAAGRVGGMYVNARYPAEFIHRNLAIQSSVIHGSYLAGVRRLIFFASNCAYPRDAVQPFSESDLLSGRMEPSSEPYAIAKLAGMSMCQAYNRQYAVRYLTVVPATLYGPGASLDRQSSHVLTALMQRFCEARIASLDEVVVRGTGEPRREFLHVDDLAAACHRLLELPDEEIDEEIGGSAWVVNVGSGEEIRIADLAQRIAEVVGSSAEISYDDFYADGAPRKLLDSTRMRRLGWSPRIDLARGLLEFHVWVASTLAPPPSSGGDGDGKAFPRIVRFQ